MLGSSRITHLTVIWSCLGFYSEVNPSELNINNVKINRTEPINFNVRPPIADGYIQILI